MSPPPYRRRPDVTRSRRSLSTERSRSFSRSPRRRVRAPSRTPSYRRSPSSISLTPPRNGKKRVRSPYSRRHLISRSPSPLLRRRRRSYSNSRSGSFSRSTTPPPPPPPPPRRRRDEMLVSPPLKRRRRSTSRDRYRDSRRRSPRRRSPSRTPIRSHTPPPRPKDLPKEPSGLRGTSIKGAASRRREEDTKMVSASPRGRSLTPERPSQSRPLIERLGASKWSRDGGRETDEEKVKQY